MNEIEHDQALIAQMHKPLTAFISIPALNTLVAAYKVARVQTPNLTPHAFVETCLRDGVLILLDEQLQQRRKKMHGSTRHHVN